MTNRQLVRKLYPNAICVYTYRGSSWMPIKYYIKNGDSHISNKLYNSSKETWNGAGIKIKNLMLEKLENAK
jgi:hypothetical protein